MLQAEQTAADPGLVRPVNNHVRGRVRFDVAGLYRSEPVREHILHNMNSVPGVRSVSANLLTGKVLVIHDSSTNIRELGSILSVLVKNFFTSSSIAPTRRYATPLKIRENSERIAQSAISVLSSTIASLQSLSQRSASSSRSTTKSKQLPTSQSIQPAWHTLDIAQVVEQTQSDLVSGVATNEAIQRLQRNGLNLLSKTAVRSDVSIFLEQFISLPVAMLGASAVISIMTGGLVDAVVIVSVIGINSVIGFVTERHSERTILSLTDTESKFTHVIRDGKVVEIAVEHVVTGDVVLLSPGSYVPADARLINSAQLTLDESPLTGESLPVSKQVLAAVPDKAPLGDRSNMVFVGTNVTGGSGKAIVVATGLATELGQIQALAGVARPPETPMQHQLEVLGTRLGLLSASVCGGIFIIGLLRGQGFMQMLKSAVSLSVAAVPEGLPAVATTTLALGIQKMRKHHVLIRHLDAVETLGAVQVFNMDKTGTLTLNRMRVVRINLGEHGFMLRSGEFVDISQNRILLAENRPELKHLLQVVSLCSEVEVTDKNSIVDGSATEIALIELALQSGTDVSVVRDEFPRLDIQYRSEEQPYMITRHRYGESSQYIAVKGSPAHVLALCDRFMEGGEYFALDDKKRRSILDENDRMAGDALRVIGMAFAEKALHASDPGLIWLGLTGMADPLRDGMPGLIEQFHDSGIDTVMITGDQSATAFAIGNELGLSREGSLKILDSSRLDEIDPSMMSSIVNDLHVFSRVSPKHKLQIVQAMQNGGKIVAMTGDGINDGPALKAANIGVAMGDSGSDVARSVADVVLEDDNLHTMIIAIEQGRSIYNNIRKALHFLLATNFSEIEVMLLGILAGKGEIMNPMQLLWINLISDIFPGLALSVEPPEQDILQQQPRDPKEPIISLRDLKQTGLESVIISAATLIVYALGLRSANPASAGTMAFTTLSGSQLLHAVYCRSDSRSMFDREKLPDNPYLKFALGGSLTAQLLTIFVPALRRLLGTARLSPVELVISMAGSIAPLLINESIKFARNNHGQSNPLIEKLPSPNAAERKL